MRQAQSVVNGGRRVRAALLIMATILVAASGCSDDQPTVVGVTMSPEELKRNCDDPQWKEKNLGLWYSVCRRPLNW